MLSITAISKQQKNKLATECCMLIIFDIMLENPVHIVMNNENVTWKGQLYQAFPVKLGTVGEDMTGTDPSVSLDVDNVALGMEYYVVKEKGAVETPVIIRVINTMNLDGEADLEEHYMVKNTEIKEEYIRFTLGNGYSVHSRRPTDRYMKNSCRFCYKGCRCGYYGDLPTCNHTLADCKRHGNSRRFGGFPGINQKGAYIDD